MEENRRQSEEPTLATVSLPRGGGAIRGVGETFTAHPFTGRGTLSVPIATSPSRSELSPRLELRYDSGGGNGPFGFGWRLDLPSIVRKTETGLPRYEDAQESDVFLLSAADDLVPAMVQDAHGAWLTDEFDRGDYRVKRYRPRIEGLFARIERWTRRADGDTHWRSISRDNVLTVYGFDAESRIADPDEPTRVFSWLVSQSYDDKGNAVVYDYVAENEDGVDTSRASERNRVRGANRYLKRIRYGNRLPLLLDVAAPGFRPTHIPRPDLAAADWMFEVVFDYGEGHYQPQPPDADGRVFGQASLAPPPGSTWSVRRDPFSSYRSGFEVRTYRLCQRILVFHHFPDELGAADTLVRSTAIEYREKAIGSFLQRITQSGHRRQPDGRYLERSFPPVELDYTSSPLEDAAYDGYQVHEVDPLSLENLPAGMDEPRWQWADLDGEGIAGALTEQGGSWFYKHNLGGGRFGPLQSVASRPSYAPTPDGPHQLLDLDGDGMLALVDLAPGAPGFWGRGEQAEWEPFRAFASLPNVAWTNPNLRLLDVTGDGRPDLVITGDECLIWHRSLGEQGFGAAVRVPAPDHEDKGPRVVFADATQSILVADLSGDGMTDIVRIRNGDVCYWPNLGYGRFGAKITMDNAPWLDAPDQFDARRVRLADTDGSGTSDLVYLGRDAVRICLNESGNAWSGARILSGLPRSNPQASISVVDLLGRGTACLVWSSPLAGDARAPLRYVDLTEGRKPHLLVHVRNNLGVETVVEYAASTEFYLEDKAAGTPWITRLPFPVHVVRRIETRDRVSGNRFVTTYSYHHGYFDGPERELRGFGRIDAEDTEEFAALTEAGELPAENIDAASHVPPVLVKTWYHTGAYLSERRISRHLEGEYYHDADAPLLPDTLLPAGLDADETREACRALRGLLLRREVYGRDGSPESDRPYAVQERNYTIQPLQPRGSRHAVFLAHPRETFDLQYERKLYAVGGQDRADPRVTHTLTLEVDDFGDVLLAATVAYGRRFDDPDPLFTAGDRDEQRRARITFTAHRFTDPINHDDAYRTPIPYETNRFELLNVAVATPFAFADLRARIELASDGAHDVAPEDVNGAAIAGADPFRRLLERERTLYRRNDLTGALPLGQAESLALPFDRHSLAFTPGLATRTFVDSGKLTAAELDAVLAGGGYVHSEGDPGWWTSSRRTFYSPGAADTPPDELDHARQHFFVPARVTDPFGATTTILYDDHDLLLGETRDPVGNVTAAQNDYRALRAALVIDPNGNRSAVAFDTLGIAVASAVMGKPGEDVGDTLDGLDADPTDATIAAHLADPLADPHALLGRATSRLVYDLHAYARTAALPRPQPASACTIQRVTHDADLSDDETTQVQQTLVYSDGLGREIQTKRQAAPGRVADGGPVVDPRWIGSGWTIFDNKGNAVRTYEPFFDDTHGFRFDHRIGASTISFYDPLGRRVGALHPDHTWEKVAFDPWRQRTWDRNDTVLVVDPRLDPDLGDRFRRLPDGEYLPAWNEQRAGGALGAEEQDAAEKTALHADTPMSAWFDCLGRTFLTIAHNRYRYGANPVVEEFHRLRVVLDAQGNRRELIDAMGRVAARGDFSVDRRAIHQASMEAGERWTIDDVGGQAIRVWDSRGHAFRTEYDALRRVVRRIVRGTDPARSDPATVATDLVFERREYGEGQPDAAAFNLRKRLFRLHDGGGVVTTDRYDFKGNVLRTTQRLPRDYEQPPDWSGAPALDPETFTNLATFDALDRPVTLTTPDGSVTRPSYDAGGRLDGIAVSVRGGASTMFVARIEYDAKGQRTRIEYGNDAVTVRRYDPLTLRMVQATTTRPPGLNGFAAQLLADAATVQDLRYTYDPVGNVTRLGDPAVRTIFHDNQQVEAAWRYEYDALYRLIEARGREHIGQSGIQQSPAGGNYRDYPFAGSSQVNDLQSVRRYTERYDYDLVGNLEQMVHLAVGGNWTRAYAYDEPSLIDPAETSNRLSRTTLQPNGAAPIVEPYAYDAHGAITEMPHLPLMRWDFGQRLRATSRQVVGGAPETTHYVHSGAGQRVRKVTVRENGTRRSERIYLRGSELYREYAGDGTTIVLERETLHVMDDAQRIALVETTTIENGAPVVAPVAVPRYQLANHLHSVNVELDGGAALITYEEYTPYGTTAYQAGRTAAEVSLKRYRYTGRERDEETGFTCHRVRHLAPWLGRWTSCDPAGMADGPNLYEYSRSNPVRFLDPAGTQSTTPERVPQRLPETALVANDNAATQAEGERPSEEKPPPEGALAQGEKVEVAEGEKPEAQEAEEQAAKEQAAAKATEVVPTEEGAADLAAPEPRRRPAEADELVAAATTAVPRGSAAAMAGGAAAARTAATAAPATTPAAAGAAPAVTVEAPAVSLSTTIIAVVFWVIAIVLSLVSAWIGKESGTAGEVPLVVWFTRAATMILGAAVALELIKREGEARRRGVEIESDRGPFDLWTIAHTLAGVVLGAWSVPFPLVAVLTVAWEFVEAYTKGLGDKEVPSNRVVDIGVAWVGWLLTAGTIALATKTEMPWLVPARDSLARDLWLKIPF